MKAKLSHKRRFFQRFSWFNEQLLREFASSSLIQSYCLRNCQGALHLRRLIPLDISLPAEIYT